MIGILAGESQLLLELNISQCTLYGFRRFSKLTTGVLLPVFKCEPERCEFFLYQRKDDDDRIVGFVGDPQLRSADIIERVGDAIFAKVGDESWHAFAGFDGQIVCEQGFNFREGLKKLLLSSEAQQSPFMALEIARFLKNPAMQKRFGRLCFRSLSKTSQDLAISWMSGSNLSPEARSGAYQELTKTVETRDPADLPKRAPLEQPTVEVENRLDDGIDFSQPLDTLRMYGFKLRKDQNFERAIFIFRAILDRFPMLVQSWMDLGHVLRKAKLNADAYKIYRELLERFPSDMERAVEVVVSLMKMDLYQEALALSTALVERFPNEPRPRISLADAHFAVRDITTASSHYIYALDRLNPDIRTSTKILRKLARANPSLALSRTVALAATFPREREVKELAGQLLFDAGQTHEAILMYELALELDARDNKRKLALANIYSRVGRYGDAIAVYKTVINSHHKPRRKKALLGLISALEALGRTDEAALLREQLEDSLPHRGPGATGAPPPSKAS
jgi:tetratricopeptide (TPR) repeat protein